MEDDHDQFIESKTAEAAWRSDRSQVENRAIDSAGAGKERAVLAYVAATEKTEIAPQGSFSVASTDRIGGSQHEQILNVIPRHICSERARQNYRREILIAQLKRPDALARGAQAISQHPVAGGMILMHAAALRTGMLAGSTLSAIGGAFLVKASQPAAIEQHSTSIEAPAQ